VNQTRQASRTCKFLWVGAAGVLWFGTLLALASGDAIRTPAHVYTATPRFDPDAWACGQERFPRGAAIRVVAAAGTRDLAPGFFASADPEVSFDGQRVLFAGKQRREDPWQIWEAPAALPSAPGEPRRIAAWPEDSIRPLYLPDGKIVYARKTAQGFQLEVLPLAGGPPLRITYAPGNYLTCDVLHDGRVLYESPHPSAESAAHDLYTVYPDGSGVEAYRCDHGVSRHAARQLASRDIVFTTNKGFARFTSALATQVDAVPVRAGEFAGPLAELSPDEWLVSFRPNARTPYALYSLNPANGALAKTPDGPGVEPMMLAAREVPLRFPSGLHDWAGANLLCLNAYTSKTNIAEGAIGSVRLYSQRAEGQPALLGETAVESDGSFFLHVPSEQPLRMELRDRSGRVIEGEHGWFWMRRGEQRICVGCHAGPERAPENAVPKVLLRKDVPVRMAGVSQ
jgi:hydrazine synthase alpha subunit-like protein